MLCKNLGQSGTLAQLSDLRRGLVVDVTPEITQRTDGTPATSGGAWHYAAGSPKLGGNIRWGITNNLNVARILADNPDCEVIVTGGVVRHRDRGIVGEATVDFIRQFKVDIGIIGISGIEADGSLRDYDYREVMVARVILEQSREVWLVADHGKFNRPAMVELARVDQIDLLFTDAAPPEPFPALLAEAGVQLELAAP